MSETNSNKPPLLFWVISTALLLWGLAGTSIYIGYFIETPEEFAAGIETAENAQAYADYIANAPTWAIAIAVIAAFTRLLGAIGLLARRAWAAPLYVISLVLFLATMYRGFVLANAASVMSGSHIAIELVFLALTIFAIWFARSSKSNGILK